jgi:ATP-dependent DNA helicase RecQ
VRDLKLVGKALFLVESKYFDATKQARIEAAEARKRKSAEQAGNPRPAKRARAAKGTSNSPIPQGSALPASQLTSEEVGAGSVLAADDNEGTANTPTESSTVTSPDIQTGTPTTALNDGPGNATAAVADDESRALFEVLRRAVYAEVPKTERKRTKRKVEEIEPALDDMINAGSRREVRCFRLPAMVYFGQRKNGALRSQSGAFLHTHARYVWTDSDHFACDPTNPAGCQHCIIRQPAVCCALCNPQIFTDFAHSDPALRPKRTRKRSSIPDYTPDQYDTGLRDALNEFREQETVKKFGKSRLKNSGPGLIMPNDILKRIIDCVHAQKITNKEDLQHETRWSRIDQFADAVLAIIDTCRRPSSSSSLTPEAASSVSTATNTKKVPKIGKSHCGACGEVGHNSECQYSLFGYIVLTFPQSQILVARNIPRRARRTLHHSPPLLLLHLRR